MKKKEANLSAEFLKHSSRVTQLLKDSNRIHQLVKEGIITEDAALDIALKLNNQGIEEAEKSIEIQKKLLAEDETKLPELEDAAE